MTTRPGEPIEEFEHRFAHAVLAATAEGIDEAIMTEYKESVEEVLRPLAETRVERVVYLPFDSESGSPRTYEESPPGVLKSVGIQSIPDPRFAALRRPILMGDWVSGPGVHDVTVNGYSWTLDASLGAIVRAAAACGFHVAHMGMDHEGVGWAVAFWSKVEHTPLDTHLYKEGLGSTPEEAAARALVAAWRDEKARSAPGPNEGITQP